MRYCKNIRYVVPVTVTLSIQLCSEDRDYSTSTKKSVFLLNSGLKCIFTSSVLPCWNENTPHIGSCFRNCYTLQSYGIKLRVKYLFGHIIVLSSWGEAFPAGSELTENLQEGILRRQRVREQHQSYDGWRFLTNTCLSYCEKLTVKADVICQNEQVQ